MHPPITSTAKYSLDSIIKKTNSTQSLLIHRLFGHLTSGRQPLAVVSTIYAMLLEMNTIPDLNDVHREAMLVTGGVGVSLVRNVISDVSQKCDKDSTQQKYICDDGV